MKITINAVQFGKIVKKILPSVPKSTPMPALENILFRFNEGEIELTATNLQTYQRITFRAEGEGKEHALIPGYMLSSLLNSLRGDISIRFTEHKMMIETEAGKYQISVSKEIGDFPDFPHFDGISNVQITPHAITEGINSVKYAMDNNNGIRPAIEAILMEEKEQGLNIVATDGHVLAKYVIPGNYGHKNIILPRDSVGILEQFVGDIEDDFIGLYFDGKMIRVEKKDEVFLSRTIADKYPNYEGVIPLDNGKTAKINKNQFLTAVKRLQILNQLRTDKITCSFGKGKLVASVLNEVTTNTARETIICEYNDEDIEIIFNGYLLSETLSNFGGEEIIIKMKSPMTAVIIREPVGDNIALIMPLRG